MGRRKGEKTTGGGAWVLVVACRLIGHREYCLTVSRPLSAMPVTSGSILAKEQAGSRDFLRVKAPPPPSLVLVLHGEAAWHVSWSTDQNMHSIAFSSQERHAPRKCTWGVGLGHGTSVSTGCTILGDNHVQWVTARDAVPSKTRACSKFGAQL